jgi:hypothetical protein
MVPNRASAPVDATLNGTVTDVDVLVPEVGAVSVMNDVDERLQVHPVEALKVTVTDPDPPEDNT